MQAWLKAALEYLRIWVEFQMRASRQPGCVVAVAHREKVISEYAFGHADLVGGETLTPRHRFRIASHSKSFTAAGIMKLRERRKLRLDDTVGLFVAGLNPQIARTTIGQVLSHSAGIVRDGADAGQFLDDRPFLNTEELMNDLRSPPTIAPNTRFKYSNHGFGLLGLVIEAIAKEPYRDWIEREVIEAADLTETEPDMPFAGGVEFARGHTPEIVLGRRLVIPGDNAVNAIAPACGFVSTAADCARFFAQLAPNAKASILSVGSRREMTRVHRRNPHSSQEGFYGLGIISGTLGGLEWFGHSGGFQGYITRTCVVPAHELTISILTNATDGFAGLWVDGALHILRTFAARGAPKESVRDWGGRWWTMSGVLDLVPVGNVVLVANPQALNPFLDATEIKVTGRDTGRIALAGGYASHGETVRRTRDETGSANEFWLAGTKYLPEKTVSAQMERRYRSIRREV
ncbi:MAG: serine hydrolase domain-containing protein [Roseiarcus sp.]|jgi:CubicO group peptidase (beta-lactamase class C family)